MQARTLNRCRLLLACATAAMATLAACGGGNEAADEPPSAPVPTVPGAPGITVPPTAQTVEAGQTARFSVVADGAAPLDYQWLRNGDEIAGAGSPSYSFVAAAADSGAGFSVRVSNSAGSITSAAATLTVQPSVPPVSVAIASQPQPAAVAVGQSVIFSVLAAATPAGTPLSYQWRRDGADLAGATAASLTVGPVALTDDGARFSVVVRAGSASQTSSEALLTVNASAAVETSLALSAAGGYALAVRSDGAVIAWGGSNVLVPLDSGTTVPGSSARRMPVPASIDVSAGGGHALIVGADGIVRGWGQNGNGVLNSQVNANIASPVELGGVSDARQALAVDGFSLALRADGRVAHWPGTTSFTATVPSTTSVVPREVEGLDRVVRLVRSGPANTGTGAALALREDGSVWALQWTLSNPGGLSTTYRFTATALAGLSNVADIACETFCVVLKSDGSGEGWGANDAGQLSGTGTPSFVPFSERVAVQLPAGTRRLQIMDTLLALGDSGRVFSWGSGLRTAGAVGRGVPVAVPVAATAVATGGGAVFVVGEDGSVRGWGTNNGLLADGSTADSDRPVLAAGLSLKPASPAISAQPVSATAPLGGSTAFGVGVDGSAGSVAYQWLRDGRAIAGADSASLNLSAVSAADDGASFSVRISASAGTTRSAEALLNVSPVPLLPGRPVRVIGDTLYDYSGAAGTTWEWGDGSSGASGASVAKVWRTPGAFSASGVGAFEVVALGRPLAHGEAHTCGIAAGASGVLCWGRNRYGQLGDGGVGDRLEPSAVPGLGPVVSVAAGLDFSCALRADGSVACWGRNASGELGDGTRLDRFVPAPVSGLAEVTAIAAGPFHACALRHSGTVHCWGSNQTSPVPVNGLNDAVTIAAGGIGGGASCAVRRDASLACWGSLGSAGAIGFGTTTPTTVPGLTGVVSVSIGSSHVCVLRSDRQVLCWGDNGNGRLGDGTSTSRAMPTAVAGLTDASSISLGHEHGCATRVDAPPVCWGAANSGAVGDGDGDSLFATQGPSVSTPRALFGLVGATALQSGRDRSCALQATGELLCWGRGGNGELGSGNASAQHFTPVPVVGGRRFWK